MKPKLIPGIFFILIFSVTNAQQSINASGGNITSTGGGVAYSIGQVFYQTSANANFSLIEGVQQPYEILTLGVDTISTINLEMKVYPNPTTTSIFLKIDDPSFKNMDYQLFDGSGKILSKSKISQPQTQIDLSTKASGIYLLLISDGSKKLKTFKIIKK
ncbi:T9SS type A sorting domain-containing protein [Chryseobacterium scophthalmum]|uniref:T9SS type A sorting domain-containing protein n=1 Tax=Chryseobacterium scophthalmum TaxID=59733 RepID=UPI00398A98E7